MGFPLEDPGLVYVRRNALAARQQSLLMHQSHPLQSSGIAGILAECFVHFAHGGTKPAERRENVQLGRVGEGKPIGFSVE